MIGSSPVPAPANNWSGAVAAEHTSRVRWLSAQVGGAGRQSGRQGGHWLTEGSSSPRVAAARRPVLRCMQPVVQAEPAPLT